MKARDAGGIATALLVTAITVEPASAAAYKTIEMV